MRFFVFLLIFPFILFAEPEAIPLSKMTTKLNENETPNYTSVHLQSEPSAVVCGSVHAITGAYFDAQTDLIIPGAEPLVIQRFYSSSKTIGTEPEEGSLFHSWDLNHGGEMVLYIEGEGQTKKYTGKYREGTGAFTVYAEKNSGDHHLPLTVETIDSGLTNCGYGEISGRTNLKNSLMIFQGPIPTIRYGSGAVRQFKMNKKFAHYNVERESKPNGNAFVYQRNRQNWLKKISAMGKTGGLLAYTLLDYDINDHGGRMVLYSSDNRQVHYRFKKNHGRYFLTQVIRPNGPMETYFYGKRKGGDAKYPHIDRIIRKERPDGRFLKIKYGEKNHKVKSLKAPVGTDATPILTHRFCYLIKRDRKTFALRGGVTSVYDAYHNQTAYGFDAKQRLTAVIKFRGASHYTIDDLIWGTGADESNLITRSFKTAQGQVQFCRHFKYDGSGNVIEDWLFGDLTGTNPSAVTLNQQGIPQGGNCYQKSYCYSTDGLNLMMIEADFRKASFFGYHPSTDLLAYKFVKVNGQILKRQFFFYDIHGVLIKEITDDGSGQDVNDWTNMTERHIRDIIPRATTPVGLPAIIFDKFLDLSTHQEILLKRVDNTYSQSGHLIRQEHYDCHEQFCYALEWEYDSMGNVTKEVNALGETILRRYDANCNLIFQQGPCFDYHTEFVYDFMNRLIREEDVYPHMRLAKTYRYNYLNQRIASSDIYGNETLYFYDDCGRLVETDYPPAPDENGQLVRACTKTHYNEMGNPIIKVDRKGFATSSSFTIRGQPTLVCHPNGTTERFEYFPDGYPLCSIDKNGTKTVYGYDYEGRLSVKETYSPTGEFIHRTTATYNAFHLLFETDPAGNLTTYKYDFAGHLQCKTKGDSKIAYTYDSLGRVQKSLEYVTEEEFLVKAQEYDFLDRVIEERIEDSQGNLIKKIGYGYDVKGNRCLIKTAHAAGLAVTEMSFNAYNEECQCTDPLGNKTQTNFHYSYLNEQGQHVACKEIIDPMGNVTLLIMDTLGRLATKVQKNSLGITTQKSEHFYDLSNNLVRTVQTVITANAPERQILTFCFYDWTNQLISCTEAVGTPEQKATHYLYNIFGQKETTLKPDGTSLAYTYDILGRLKTFKGTDISYVYTYDANSNVVRVDDLINNTATIRSYDQNDRLILETLGNGLSLAYTYDKMGQLTQITLPDQSSIQYLYQGFLKEVRRLTKNSYSHFYKEFDLAGNLLLAQSPAGSLSYQYDLLGRMHKITSSTFEENIPDDGYDKVGNLLQCDLKDRIGLLHCKYSYDDLYQLTNEEGITSHRYLCDSIYNRLEKDGTANQVNSLNQLLDDGQHQYHYDPNGNLVKLDQKIFNYDALDRLIEVVQGNQKVCYLYDENHRRLSKKCYLLENEQWQLENTIHYLYQQYNEIGSIEKGEIKELRLLGIGKGAEIGASVAFEFNQSVFFPLHDHNGNVVSFVDQNGNPQEIYRFSAFGEEQLFSPSGESLQQAINPWRFSSKRYDEETGLIYFGRRYYNPEIGRWLTADPLEGEKGPNLYAYVLNNPLTHFDLYGLETEPQVARGEPTFFKTDFYERVRDTVDSFSRLPGRLLEYIGRNWVPIPVISDGIEILGRLFAGRGLKDYVPSFRRGHSRRFVAGSKEIDGLRVSYTNGVNVKESEFLMNCWDLSFRLGGIQVHGIYNSSRGIAYDFLECALQKLGIPVRVSEVLRQELVGLSQKGTNEIWEFVHSQGGLTLDSIRGKLPKEVKANMIVTTLGSPKMIPREGFKEVTNYVNGCDMVSWLFDPLGCARGLWDKNSNVKILPVRGTPWGSHMYNSDGYRKAKDDVIGEILKNYGGAL